MSRRLITTALILTLMLAVAIPVSFASIQVPVLGWTGAFHSGTGFGTVKPGTVFLGGDPTGEVKSVIWHHWGRARAVGHGTGWCPGSSVANGHPCPAALRISNIGSCHGQRAYRKLAFYFKTGSSWTAGSKYNICSGSYLP